MKKQWEIIISPQEKERIAITYGDPADALVPTKNYTLYELPNAIANWHALSPLLKNDHWYDVTAFYSKRRSDLSKKESKQLFEYNQKAFDAAKKLGNLVLYFQGVLLEINDETSNEDLNLSFVPNCLSFCIWNTLADAKKGAQASDHKKAASMVATWYDGFAIKKYQLMLTKAPQTKQLIFRSHPYQA